MKRPQAIARLGANEILTGDIFMLPSFDGFLLVISIDSSGLKSPAFKTKEWMPYVSLGVLHDGKLFMLREFATWSRNRIERVWQNKFRLVIRDGRTAKDIKRETKRLFKEQATLMLSK